MPTMRKAWEKGDKIFDPNQKPDPNKPSEKKKDKKSALARLVMMNRRMA